MPRGCGSDFGVPATVTPAKGTAAAALDDDDDDDDDFSEVAPQIPARPTLRVPVVCADCGAGCA